MSNKMQAGDANTRKRKISGSLMNDDEVLVGTSDDSDGVVEEGTAGLNMTNDKILAETSDVSDKNVDEDYTDKQSKTTFPVKRRKVIHDQSDAITGDDAPRLDTLPMELLQQIMKHPDIKSFLCMKLTSSRLSKASKTSKGKDLRHFKRLGRVNRARIFAEFEAQCNGRITTGKLICSMCYKRFGNDAHGFSDEQFDQRLITRKCVECLLLIKKLPSTFTITVTVGQTVTLYYCHICSKIKPIDQAAKTKDLKEFYDSVWWPSVVSSSTISTNNFELPKQKMTESTLICRTCVNHALSAAKVTTAEAQMALVGVLEQSYRRNTTMNLMLGLKPSSSNHSYDALSTLMWVGHGSELLTQQP